MTYLLSAVSYQLSGGNLADSDLLIAESSFMRDFILNLTQGYNGLNQLIL